MSCNHCNQDIATQLTVVTFSLTLAGREGNYQYSPSLLLPLSKSPANPGISCLVYCTAAVYYKAGNIPPHIFAFRGR